MIQFLLFAAILLLVVTVGYTIKINNLLDEITGRVSRVVPSKNKLQARSLMVFLIAGLGLFFYYSFGGLEQDYQLPLASEHGVSTDRMFNITMILICIVLAGTHVILFGFSFKYQHRPGHRAYFYPQNHKLEITWTVVTAVILSTLVFSGWRVWVGVTQPAPDGAHVVEITGYQFAWGIRYPGFDGQLGAYNFRKIDAINPLGIDVSDPKSSDDFVSTQIHLPVGEPVLFKIRSRDVIHSVFVPYFRVQMNAVPGMPTRFWFIPTKTTQQMRDELGDPEFDYELACNKICGTSHYAMRAVIVVEEPEEYRAWYAAQPSWMGQNAASLTASLADSGLR